MTGEPAPADDPGQQRTVVQRIVNIYGNMTGTINEVGRVVEVGAQTERRRLLRAVRMLVDQPVSGDLGGPPISLSLESCPAAVSGRSPGEHTLAGPLPRGTRLAEVFQQNDQKLLILGEGGSGKKTALRSLALTLVNDAEKDEALPVPVILRLASWGKRHRLLADWLVDEIGRPGPYDQGREQAASWVQREKFLPLLLGLDEIEPDRRDECLEAINEFRESRKSMRGMAVTCRTDDYDALSPRQLSLRGAVRLCPLADEQIDEYLAARRLDVLRAEIGSDPTLRQMAASPLTLSFLASRYADRPDATLPEGATAEERLDSLLEDYVNSRLDNQDSKPLYTREQTAHWLGWLARSLLGHGEREFYLDRLQPDWLPGRGGRIMFAVVDRCGSALLGACFFGLLFGLHFLARGAEFVLVGALVGALVGGLLGGQPETNVGAKPPRMGFARGAIPAIAIVGSAAGLITAFAGGDDLLVQVAVLTGGGASALVGGLAGGLGVRGRTISLRGPLSWSPILALRHALGGLIIGLAVGVVVGFIGVRSDAIDLPAIADPDADPLRFTLLAMFLTAALFGPITALGFGLVGGVVSGIVEGQKLPNQAVRRSARRALLVFAGVTLVASPLATLVLVAIGGSRRLLDNVPVAVQGGLLIGPILGFVAALAFGGYACLSYAALRVTLWRCGVAPLAYVRFLEYAKRLGFLTRLGGGYEFRPGLLEYFARRYATSSTPRS